MLPLFDVLDLSCKKVWMNKISGTIIVQNFPFLRRSGHNDSTSFDHPSFNPDAIILFKNLDTGR